MDRHEVSQDLTDQFGHAQPVVERVMPEPAANFARDRDGELHCGRLPCTYLFLGEDKCRLPHRVLRHMGSSACVDFTSWRLVSRHGRHGRTRGRPPLPLPRRLPAGRFLTGLLGDLRRVLSCGFGLTLRFYLCRVCLTLCLGRLTFPLGVPTLRLGTLLWLGPLDRPDRIDDRRHKTDDEDADDEHDAFRRDTRLL